MKKTSAALLTASLIITTILFAESKKEPMQEYQNLFVNSLGAKGVQVVYDGKNTSDGKGKGKIDDSFMDTVIYNDIYDKSFHRGQERLGQPSNSEFKANGIKLAQPKTDYLQFVAQESKKMAEAEEERLKAEKAKQEEKPKYYVGGYCIATNRTEIIKASSFANFDCLLNFGNNNFREIQVFAGIYPNYQKEILVGLPMYATLPDGRRASMRGIVMNVDKTTLNIANEVESYKIRRWVAKYGLTINNIAYKYAMMYLNDLRLSKINEQVTFVDSQNSTGVTTTVPVTTTQVAPPDSTEMLKMAGVELIGRLVALGAENILEDTSPLFTIYKGQRVWVEGVIDTDNAKMFGTFNDINGEVKKSIQQDNSKFEDVGKKIIEQGAKTDGNIGAQMPTSSTGTISQ